MKNWFQKVKDKWYIFAAILLIFFLLVIVIRSVYNAFFNRGKMFEESVQEVQEKYIPTIERKYKDAYNSVPEFVKAEYYVRAASMLAYHLSTDSSLWFFQRWYENDYEAYLILQKLMFLEEVDAVNVHYKKLTNGGDILTDAVGKLDRDLMDKLAEMNPKLWMFGFDASEIMEGLKQ